MGKIVQASINEFGTINNGAAGDQTGSEVNISSYYSDNWTQIFRHPDPTIARRAAQVGIILANSNRVGYDQLGITNRMTLYNALKKCDWSIRKYLASGKKTNADCASFVHACYCVVEPKCRDWTWSPTCSSWIPAASGWGFQTFVSPDYTRSESRLRVGDLINNSNRHIVMYIGNENTDIDSLAPPFKPRLSAPSITNKYWLMTSHGGLNVGIPGNKGHGSTLSNCTSYAWGRFLEIMHDYDKSAKNKIQMFNAGQWYSSSNDGYARGKTPQLGAVLCMGEPGAAGHVAIVEKINDDGSIVTSESGWNNASVFWTSTRYPPNYCRSPYYFQGFIYNPYVGSGAEIYDSTSGYGVRPLYADYTLNDSKDASVREVCYLSSDYSPSIRSSDIKLSVINYTTGLAAFFNSVLLPNVSRGAYNQDYINNLDGVPAKIIDFFCDNGFSPAVGVGWCGNIEAESGFKCDAIGDTGTSYGLCQWHASRRDAMVRFVGADWRTNVTGQLKFLLHELKTSHSGTYAKMKSIPNTLDGAKDLAKYICIHFEVPSDKYSKAEQRANNCKKYWDKLTPLQTSVNKRGE